MSRTRADARKHGSGAGGNHVSALRLRLVLPAAIGAAIGCSTTHATSTKGTATEPSLISHSVGQPLPLVVGNVSGKEDPSLIIAVSRPAAWAEAPESAPVPEFVAGQSSSAVPPKAAAPALTAVPPSVESVGTGGPAPKAGAAPGKAGPEAASDPSMPTIQIPWYTTDGPGESGKSGSGNAAGPASGRGTNGRPSPALPAGDRPK
jgi:hypothetical protein